MESINGMSDPSFEHLVTDRSFIEWLTRSNPDSVAMWEKWIEEHPEHAKVVAEAKHFLKALIENEKSLSNAEVDIEVKKILSHIKVNQGGSAPFWSGKNMIRIAATVVLGAIGLWLFQTDLFDKTQIEAQASIISKENPRGQKSTLFLSDGSKIILSPESKISYTDHFLSYKREVVLEYGQAYFDVAKDIAKPFFVRTSNLLIEVTGTEFNVSAYPEDQNEAIGLIEGSVIVRVNSKNDQKAVLAPKEVGVYSKGSKSLNVEALNESDISWITGVLDFKSAPLTEVVSKLERWYGVDIELINGDARRVSFTGTFDNDNLRNVLNGLCFSLNCDFKLSDKVVVIDLKKNQQP